MVKQLKKQFNSILFTSNLLNSTKFCRRYVKLQSWDIIFFLPLKLADSMEVHTVMYRPQYYHNYN